MDGGTTEPVEVGWWWGVRDAAVIEVACAERDECSGFDELKARRNMFVAKL